MEPERRYALDALLDALGLPFEEGAPATTDELDETFALLTLASEREAELDAHGRPLPPQAPQGPRLAELATVLGERLGVERRGYPGGERFVIALTHDVDLLGAGGARTAARRLAGGIVHRSRRHLREGTAFALDALRGRDPAYPLGAMLDAEARPRLDLLLPHASGRPARRLSGALSALPSRGRSSERRPAGREIALHASYRARERPGRVAEEAETLPGAQGLRHHYLRSAPERLAAELREAGLRYDSSIGWPSLPGLRAGTPYPYRLWDARAP